MAIYTVTFHRTVFIFMMQVYIYILHSILSTLLQTPITSACTSRPLWILPEYLPSIQPNTLTLWLTQAVRPWERVTLPLCRLSLSIWTNLVHQTHSSYFNLSTISPSSHSAFPSPSLYLNHWLCLPWTSTQTQCSTLFCIIPVRPSPLSWTMSP